MTNINYLIEKYDKVISNIISSVQFLFPNFKSAVKYKFLVDDISIIGLYTWKNDCLNLNIGSIDFAFEQINQPYEIVKFIIHELRHRYQYLAINDYHNGLCDYEDKETILSWEKSFNEYSGLIPKNKESEIKYYNQSIELDAFAFSHAAIIELYNNSVKTEIPEYYIDNSGYNNLLNKHREKIKANLLTFLSHR